MKKFEQEGKIWWEFEPEEKQFKDEFMALLAIPSLADQFAAIIEAHGATEVKVRKGWMRIKQECAPDEEVDFNINVDTEIVTTKEED